VFFPGVPCIFLFLYWVCVNVRAFCNSPYLDEGCCHALCGGVPPGCGLCY